VVGFFAFGPPEWCWPSFGPCWPTRGPVIFLSLWRGHRLIFVPVCPVRRCSFPSRPPTRGARPRTDSGSSPGRLEARPVDDRSGWLVLL